MQVRSACPSGDYLSVGFFLNRGCTSFFTPTLWRPPLRRRDLADRAGSDCQISLMGIISTIIKIIIIILIIYGTRGLRLSNISGGHNAPHCGRRRWSGTSLNYLLRATISTCTWYNTCSVVQYILNRHSRAGAITTHCKVHMVHRNTLQTHQVH